MLTGLVTLQGRNRAAGVIITVTVDAVSSGGANPNNPVTAISNDSYPNFVLSVLPGTYTVVAAMRGYLQANRTGVKVASGQTINLPNTTLVAGDVNGDGVIDQIDVTLVASNFEKGADQDPRADITGDGHVDIIDLVLVGSNLGKMAQSLP